MKKFKLFKKKKSIWPLFPSKPQLQRSLKQPASLLKKKNCHWFEQIHPLIVSELMIMLHQYFLNFLRFLNYYISPSKTSHLVQTRSELWKMKFSKNLTLLKRKMSKRRSQVEVTIWIAVLAGDYERLRYWFFSFFRKIKATLDDYVKVQKSYIISRLS